MCLHGYGVATVHRQCKVLFIFPLINLFGKKTTQNRYSINVTFLDYEHNWNKGLINQYKEVFLVGRCWNRIIWNVIRHLKSDCKIFVWNCHKMFCELAHWCTCKIVLRCFVNLTPELIIDQQCLVFSCIFDFHIRDPQFLVSPSTEPPLCQSDWLTVTSICSVVLNCAACAVSGRRSQ